MKRAPLLAFVSLLSGVAFGGEPTYGETPDLPKTPLTDFTAPVKNVPLGGGFTGSIGGSVQHRYQDLDNRRDFNSSNTTPDDHDYTILARERINGELKYDGVFR